MSTSTSSIRSKRPGRWKPEHELALLVLAERVLELVAVAEELLGRHDRLDGRGLEASDPLERVAYLRLLLLELALVGQHLPGRARMRRHRLDAVRARLDQLDQLGLGPGALRLPDPSAHAVARHGAADEHDVARLRARDTGASVGEAIDAEFELIAAAGPGTSCLLLTGRQPSLVSIEFSTVLRFAWRRS